MIYAVSITEEAYQDIMEAAVWYESHQSGLARHFIAETDSAADRVSANPNQFPEIGRGVRRILLSKFPYAAYFIVEQQVIRIFAVLHQHRDPEIWAERLG